MPDPRPLSAVRSGPYDDPPANTETSTPQTRRSRLRRALQDTNDLTRSANDVSTLERFNRPSLLSPINRRRPHSPDGIRETHRYVNTGTPSAEKQDDGRRARRAKRRRLDPDETPAYRQPHKYGHFGQVEAGRLKLDLVSCDGGECVDPRSPGTYLGALNLLLHDRSVYCSERVSASAVLRHADDTPFSLEKLHIVGPEHGFTAPVREGLVYVAMNLSDLQKYLDPPPHARRNNVDTPPYYSARPPRSRGLQSPERLSLRDALRDPEIGATLDRMVSGGDETASRGTQPQDTSSTSIPARAQAMLYEEDFGASRSETEPHCELPPDGADEAADEADTDLDPSVPATFLSDEDAGPEESTPQDVLDFRLQRMRLVRRRHDLWDLDREERQDAWSDLVFDPETRNGTYMASSRLDQLMSRSRIRDSPAPLPTSNERGGPVVETLQAAETDAADDPAVTCTRFRIQGDKHKVAIRFEPALSGRFILLKMWSQRSAPNVDVQAVIAKGFGGCRFFPAREPV